MTLEFRQLTDQVQKMGTALAERALALQGKAEQARARLRQAAAHIEELRDKIERLHAAGIEWRGAAPTDEPPDRPHPLPEAPARATLMAADGSQIFPDPHAIALYYLINVGSIIYEHGSGQAPDCYSLPVLHYREQDLYPDDGDLIRAGRIENYRDLAEIERLALLTEGRGDVLTVTLTDGPLLLYSRVGTNVERDVFEQNLLLYLGHLTSLQQHGVIAAGYVDRPRSPWVVSLLDLDAHDLSEPLPPRLERRDFKGLDDEALFQGLLKPGERSALFAVESAVNRRYEEHGHRIYFFYLNVSTSAQPKIARVEVPEWVVKRPGALDNLHALLCHQCRIMDGYPYVLARAHELAVVTPEDKRQLEDMVIGALLHCGLSPEMSNKARTKQLTRSGARRHQR